MHARRIAFATATAFVTSLGAAAATTLERMSIEQMTHAAEAIVRARCVANSTAWDAGEIWTFTSFEIESTWKGAPRAARITVRLLGGRIGELTSHVSGVPRFRPGEELVLFLEPSPRGDFSVVSWMQGTFRIRRDSHTGEERATQDTAAFATFQPGTRRFEVAGLRNAPLNSLHEQVAAALRETAGRQQ